MRRRNVHADVWRARSGIGMTLSCRCSGQAVSSAAALVPNQWPLRNADEFDVPRKVRFLKSRVLFQEGYGLYLAAVMWFICQQ